MIRLGSILVCAAALVTAGPAAVSDASGRCYNTYPDAPGSVAACTVSGTGRYVVASAAQWELRVYRGETCTGSAGDIDTLTRAGRTPSAGMLDFGAEARCVELRLTGPGVMVVDAEALP